jgi:DNA-binding PadR family transcriptional regulator
MLGLSHVEIALLSVLHLNEEQAGREVAASFRKEIGREIALGTLYTTLRRLKEEGLVNARDDEDEDGRIRFFTITANGTRALVEARNHYRRVFSLAWQPSLG